MYSSCEMSLTEKYMMADRVRTKLFSCVDKDTNGVEFAEHVSLEANRKNKHNKNKKHAGSRDLNLRVLVGHAMVLDRLMEDISACSMRERSVESTKEEKQEKEEEVCSDSDSDEEYDDEKKYLYGAGEQSCQPLQKVYSHDGGVFYTHGNGSVLDTRGVAVEEKACYSDDEEEEDEDDYYSDSDSDCDSDDDTAVYVLRGRGAGMPGSKGPVAYYSNTGSSVDIHSISPICV